MIDYDTQVNVLFKIQIESKVGKNLLFINSLQCTAYPEEQEVLLQSGLKATIESIQNHNDY